jgi:hypothetical protein
MIAASAKPMESASFIKSIKKSPFLKRSIYFYLL